MIPTLDPRREGLDDALIDAFTRVLRSGRYINGPEVEAFEQEVAAWIGVPHAIGVSSGTDALLVALMALDIGPGDEVIVPAYTFFATAGAVARLGATPVFVDSEWSGNLDPSAAAAAVTSNTKAIIPVHLFGRCADLPPLEALGIPLVEDVAQAQGASSEGRPAGSVGRFGTFSFFPTKNLGGLGDGGLVTTTDDTLAGRARRIRAHGAQPKYVHHEVGGNFRLDALQAALLRVKLPGLSDRIAARRAIAARYDEALSDLPLTTPEPAAGHTYNQYVVRIPEHRDRVRRHLHEAGVGTAVYYPSGLHQQACFAHLPACSLPVAEKLCRETLALPVFPELTEPEQARVVDALRGAFAS
ncbi:MAG: DegT/DnrJ/EryC1/StrS family aminotransferase [Sandaracinaceae bacterium]